MSKYGSRKVYVNGEVFDSKREYTRYRELVLLQKAGQVSDLKRQVRYELIPTQKVDGKVAERACTYVADFEYKENGKTVVEDTKGFRTKDYIVKRKLMLFIHGIRIREV